nr:hypothetical protein [uncultured Oscillibacter sp.]
MNGIQMDGRHYRVRIVYDTMERSFSLAGGSNEGYMLSRRHERDLVGSGYSYELGIEPDPRFPEDYDAFYDAVSAPVDSHEITMPYGQSSITFQAEIQSGTDRWRGRLAGKNRWSGLKILYTPIDPQRPAE